MTSISVSNIESFIIDYIRGSGVDDHVELVGETNFVDQQLLDSFAILTLIMDLEAEYAIKFELSELADPALRTVGGLAEAVRANLK